jgi:hypothetical protein
MGQRRPHGHDDLSVHHHDVSTNASMPPRPGATCDSMNVSDRLLVDRVSDYLGYIYIIITLQRLKWCLADQSTGNDEQYRPRATSVSNKAHFAPDVGLIVHTARE